MNLVITIPEPDFEGLGKTEAEARLDLAIFFLHHLAHASRQVR